MATSTAGGAMVSMNEAEWSGRRVLVAGTCGDLDIALTEALGRLSALVHVEHHGEVGHRSMPTRGHTAASDRYQSVLALTQSAVKALGGLDGVVTLVELDRCALEQAVADDAIERFCGDTLAGPLAAIRVALNRMGTTWVEGAMTAVLVIPPGLSVRAALVARIARAMLVDMVRAEAVRAAPFGISVRAVILDQAVSEDAEVAIAAILSSISLAAASLSGVAVEVDG